MFYASENYCFLKKNTLRFLDSLTSRGLASVGDLVSQMYKLKTKLASTKPTLKFA
jgi:hypothetical protein